MTFSSNNGFIPKITCGTINIVRVCVKASPAEGRRRLHTNTAYARLSGFNKFSCEASPAYGVPCHPLVGDLTTWLLSKLCRKRQSRQ